MPCVRAYVNIRKCVMSECKMCSVRDINESQVIRISLIVLTSRHQCLSVLMAITSALIISDSFYQSISYL